MILAQVLGRQVLLGTEVHLRAQGAVEGGADIGQVTCHAVGGCHVHGVGEDDLDVITVPGDGDTLDGTVATTLGLGSIALQGVIGHTDDVGSVVGRVFTDHFETGPGELALDVAGDGADITGGLEGQHERHQHFAGHRIAGRENAEKCRYQGFS